MLPLQCGEMGAFYRIWGPMELSAVIGYTTPESNKLVGRFRGKSNQYSELLKV
jgi:hypothetical protein